MTFTLAIVGRPNVGKSTLFNRLARKNLAIVNDQPGVTRDWREAPGWLLDQPITVIDTAGLENVNDASIEARMRQQTERAVERADAVLFVIDARAGLTNLDRHFSSWMRRTGKKVVLAANKCESQAIADAIQAESYALGLGEAITISASHGYGMEDIYAAFEEDIKAAQKLDSDEAEQKALRLDDLDSIEGDLAFDFAGGVQDDPDKPIRITIAGRPNVGKSTLMNTLLNDDRVMTGPEAGITRDAIAASWDYKGQKIRLVDTAGMRRKARVDNVIEKMSVDDTLRSVRLSQIVIFMIDATQGLDKQDLQIARHLHEEGRAIVLAVNKWDAVDDKSQAVADMIYTLETSFAQIDKLPTAFISALKGRNLDSLMDRVLEVYKVWSSRVSTGKLNRWLDVMTQKHPPPLVSGRPNKLRYMTQVKSRPPTFAMWCSKPDDLPATYQRYLINGLRDSFSMNGIAVRLVLRKSKNPFVS